MKLVFGSDHAGFTLRQSLCAALASSDIQIIEVGASSDEPFDYPDAADALAQQILEKKAELGVLICGSGIGVCIRANRYQGIRAANCCSVDGARLARQHNHANVLCLGARSMDTVQAIDMVRTFLATDEDPDERHERRVKKLDSPIPAY